MRKICELGRYVLSKFGADKKEFLSAVIKSFLRRMAQMRRCFLTKCTIWVGDDKNIKQMSHYAQETGRSMVEMLGVLAIIGVLSVGGIAGYSKAMMKHKLNKTINQITTISQGIRTLCLNGAHQCKGLYCIYNTSAPSLKNGCKMLKSLNLIPEDMWKEDTNDIINLYGGGVQIDYGAENYGLKILYYSLPTDACLDLATINWTEVASGVTQLSIGVNVPTIYGYSKEYATKNNITLTRENSIPLPVASVSNICNMNNPSIVLTFDEL